MGAQPGTRSAAKTEGPAPLDRSLGQGAPLTAGAGGPDVDQGTRRAALLQVQHSATAAGIAVDEGRPVNVVHVAVFAGSDETHRDHVQRTTAIIELTTFQA